MSQNLQRMAVLIENFNSLRSTQQGERIIRMSDFFTTYSEFQKICGDQGVATFNVFRLLGIDSDEVRHSTFLAWLLDARSGHHQGYVFLNAFVRSCLIDIPAHLLSEYHVRTEFSEVESIIDVLVYRKAEFLIYVENKVHSEEGIKQLDREFGDMQRLGSRLGIPQDRQYAVFLTPDGRKPSSGDPKCWRTLSYQQLKKSLEPLLPQITSDKVRFALEDWLEVIATFGRE